MPEPTAELPYMPGYDEMIEASGGKPLPWSWAVERLASCRNLLLTSVRPDGRPHVMPIWGIWRDGAFEFSTGQQSRKAKNMRGNPNVAVAAEDGADCVIIEGVASIMPRSSHAAFIDAYAAKYDWQVTEEMGPFCVVTPTVVFGIREYGDKDTGGVTRWTFR
jgi:nitroimidazol reductase NimA-like FMN-containing flavoprotein (pyridoxamine 5'-phosphate oxidase superfamily)